jgi:hypothetical protein
MKLSSTISTLENKDKIIGLIKEFFDTEFISKVSRLTNFVERESKLGGLIFFSLCIYSKERRDNKFGRFMPGATKRRD